MTTKPYLVVPICVDALIESKGRYILSALADFSLLPYVEKNPQAKDFRDEARPKVPIDVGSDTAYISENIVAQPFGDQNFYLKPGVHLHWAMPDALILGRHPNKDKGKVGEVDGTKPLGFHNAPNRWRVTRSGGGLPPKIWIVESDYLDNDPASSSVAYPLTDPKANEPPFCRLGRVTVVTKDSAYREKDDADTLEKRGEPLTAMGWGDPYFHSFYPNCHSVFGLHDADVKDAPTEDDLVYSVMGWYSSLKIDPVTKIINKQAKDDCERAFGWKMDEASWAKLQGGSAAGMICYGKITVTSGAGNPKADSGRHASKTKVVFGNSGAEAVAAHMANQSPNGKPEKDKRELEQTFAAMRYHRELQDRQVDHHAKLEEARHTASFTALPGGTLWTFRELPSPPMTKQDASNGKKPIPLSAVATSLLDELDDAIQAILAKKLHLLNQYQLACDRGMAVIRSLRRQCYADWYKYMVCNYRPPEATRDHDYPAIDDVKRLIETDIAWLNLICRFVGLEFPKKHSLSPDTLRSLQARMRERHGSSTSTDEERMADLVFEHWLNNFLSGEESPSSMDSDEFVAALAECNAECVAVIARAVIPQGSALGPLNALASDESFGGAVFRSLTEHRDALQSTLKDMITMVGELLTTTANKKFTPTKDLAAIADNQVAAIQEKVKQFSKHVETAPGESAAVFAELAIRFTALELREVPAPRFWRPNEPTLLLAGEDVTPSDRHGHGALLWVCATTVNVESNKVPDFASGFFTHKPANWDLKKKIASALDDVAIHTLVTELANKLKLQAPPDRAVEIDTLVFEYAKKLKLKLHTLTNKTAEIDTLVFDYKTKLILKVSTTAGIDTLLTKYADKLKLQSLTAEEIVTLVSEFASERKLADEAYKIAYYYDHLSEVAAWARSEVDAWGRSQSIITRTTEHTPWHPLFVEWEVAVLPLGSGGNVPAKYRRYRPEFIKQNYTLKERSAKLASVVKEATAGHEFLHLEAGGVTPSSTVFSGRSILSPHAVRVVRQHVEKTIARNSGSPGGTSSGAQTMLDHAREAHQLLVGAPDEGKQPLIAQSQSLSGFNDGLLMHRQTMQLPISDPLGFEDYQDFTETIVRQAVADQKLVAPEPWFDFHPIRTGQMRIRHLRLIDTFGQVRPVTLGNEASIESSHALAVDVQVDEAHSTVNLPPRLTQPARVNFRWLSAADDAQETNSHALTSPVCGWVVPNNLDRSLMIYDGDGSALGYIEETGRWRSAPGRSGPVMPADIGNPHLARMVGWICERARSAAEDNPKGQNGFMDEYLQVLDSALENIEPESFAQHEALALLIGRPMALVRAFVNLELQGPPACPQSWEDLHRRLRGEPPGTDGFCDVKFPFRIGEHLQLNDGVVGFWLEDADGYREDLFYAPQSDYQPIPPNEKIFIYRDKAGGPLNFQHAIDDAPQLVSLLMDPRGVAHCTCGVLPTKALALPVEHTAGALKRIKVSFLSAPVLCEPGRINMPLPTEPGFTWSWIQIDDLRWKELTTTPTVERAAFEKAFPSQADAVWSWLASNDRISPIPGAYDTAFVLPKSKWKPKPDWQEKPLVDLADIERVLDVSERVLSQVSQEARFGPAQEIREGWLELTPSDNNSRSGN